VAGAPSSNAALERELVMAGISSLNATCDRKVLVAGTFTKHDTQMSGGGGDIPKVLPGFLPSKFYFSIE